MAANEDLTTRLAEAEERLAAVAASGAVADKLRASNAVLEEKVRKLERKVRHYKSKAERGGSGGSEPAPEPAASSGPSAREEAYRKRVDELQADCDRLTGRLTTYKDQLKSVGGCCWVGCRAGRQGGGVGGGETDGSGEGDSLLMMVVGFPACFFFVRLELIDARVTLVCTGTGGDGPSYAHSRARTAPGMRGARASGCDRSCRRRRPCLRTRSGSCCARWSGCVTARR